MAGRGTLGRDKGGTDPQAVKRERERLRKADYRARHSAGKAPAPAARSLPTEQDKVAPARFGKCRFRNRAGAPCPFQAIAPDGGCATHSQHEVALKARRERAAKGGRAHSNIARAMRIVRTGPFAELAEILEKAALEVYEGNLDPQRGTAIAILARGVVTVADAAGVKPAGPDQSDLAAFLNHLRKPRLVRPIEERDESQGA